MIFVPGDAAGVYSNITCMPPSILPYVSPHFSTRGLSPFYHSRSTVLLHTWLPATCLGRQWHPQQRRSQLNPRAMRPSAPWAGLYWARNSGFAPIPPSRPSRRTGCIASSISQLPFACTISFFLSYHSVVVTYDSYINIYNMKFKRNGG